MEKHLIDRRMDQMAAEGVTFRTSTEVGKDVTIDQLLDEFRRCRAVAVAPSGRATWTSPGATWTASIMPWIS